MIPNKVIADHVASISKFIANKLYKFGTVQYNKFLVSFDFCFTAYLNRSYDRYSKIKTLLYRDKPVPLASHYVQANFRIGQDEIEGVNLFDHLVENKNSVIVGTAGSGKSVFMKKLFMTLIDDKKQYIPVLVELRLLTSSPEGQETIFDYIFKTISDSNDDFKKEQLEYALKQGKIALLLDGFDEIDYEKKIIYEKEILGLSNRYSESIFLITSRPDGRFSSWHEFYVYKVLPLNQSQAVELISKIDYESTVRDKFISELNDGLFEKHWDFLSNPLLLTMMLLTYEQLAEIPEKIHIFYEQAFDTLYHKHDASKAVYKRKTYCGLPIDDFRKIFSIFCIVTYSDRKFSFSKEEILASIKKAIDVADISNINHEDFFNDLLESVCVIQKDGDTYIFSHRSFQEYFSAYFLSQSKSIDVAKVLDRILLNSLSDSVIKMLYELNKELVEKDWLIPRLKKIILKTKGIDVENNPIEYLSHFYDAFVLIEDVDDNSNGKLDIGYGFSPSVPDGYFYSLARKLNQESLSEFYQNHLMEIEEDDTDAEIFIKNISCEMPFDNVITFSSLEHEDTSWLSQTTIPRYCVQLRNSLSFLHKELKDKYAKKSHELSSMLFQ